MLTERLKTVGGRSRRLKKRRRFGGYRNAANKESTIFSRESWQAYTSAKSRS